jgi:hypothetical protein
MKIERSIIVSFVLLVLIASLYRLLPGRPLGFAPQIAIALFSGSIIQNKRYSFLLPISSMLLSDIFYEVLFQFHISPIVGFYNGQVENYLLFVSVTLIGFAIRKENWFHILAGSVAGPSFYFLLSNCLVWVSGGLGIDNLPYAKSWDGLLACYTAAIPFYLGSLYATFFFSVILFGVYSIYTKYSIQRKAAV